MLLTPEEFAVLPWGWTPGDHESLETIRECGFNLAGFVAPEHLDIVAAAGLKCIVSEGSTHVGDAAAAFGMDEIQRRVNALVERVKGHEAIFGYYLRDEPGAAAFPGTARDSPLLWSSTRICTAPRALRWRSRMPPASSL